MVKNLLNQYVEEFLNKFVERAGDDARSSFVSRRLPRPRLASGLWPRIFSVRRARTVACRGRSRLPEVRRGQGERGTGPDRPDLRSRRVRCGISAEGGGARRQHHQLRLCRRKSSAARNDRQSAALADHARAGGSSAPRELSRKFSGKLFRKLSESGAAAADLCRAVERPDLAVRAGHRHAGG